MLDDSRIREALLAHGLATENDLLALDRERTATGQSLYRTALGIGGVDEAVLVGHLAASLGVSSVSLERFSGKPRLVALLPPPVVKKHQVLPVGLKDHNGQETLFLAMADPHDLDALEAVGQCCTHPVVPLLAGPFDLEAAIERVYTANVDGDTPTIPPGGMRRVDAISEVMDLEPAQPAEVLSALSLLDDIPRTRHEDVTPATGMELLVEARRQASGAPLAIGSTRSPSTSAFGITDFGRPLTDPRSESSDAPGMRSDLPWEARPTQQLVRALIRTLIARGVFTEEELAKALDHER